MTNGPRKLAIYRTAVICLAAAVCSQAVEPAREPGESYTASTMSTWEFNGRLLEYHVDAEDLADSPAWPDPEDGDPPLSMAQAIAISRQELARQSPETREWNLGGIALDSLGEEPRWYYVIAWRPKGDGAESGSRLFIPVFMSGRAAAVEPQDRNGASPAPCPPREPAPDGPIAAADPAGLAPPGLAARPESAYDPAN